MESFLKLLKILQIDVSSLPNMNKFLLIYSNKSNC